MKKMAMGAAGPNDRPQHSLGTADPYFRMAERTRFVDYGGVPKRSGFEVAIARDSRDIEWPRRLKPWTGSQEDQFLTARVNRKMLLKLRKTRGIHVSLAMPVVPQRRPQPWRSPAMTSGLKLAGKFGQQDDSTSEVLLGIIDDGCPFAHADFRRLGKPLSTRIFRLWDQGGDLAVEGRGTRPPYGHELTRAHLDELMAANTDASGNVDEHACYLMCGYGAVLPRRSHGAHSLGLMAAPRLWNGRPSEPAAELRKARPAGDPLTMADIVFVQLPHALTSCVSVGAMEARAFDAIRYIIDIALRRKSERVFISFGYESWVGPHDGSGWFSRAVDELLRGTGDLQVELHLPAGNGRRSAAHVAYDGDAREVVWNLHVLPDNEVPTFVEIWLPESCRLPGVELRPPGGRPGLGAIGWEQHCVWPSEEMPQAAVLMPPQHGTNRMILLRIAPTRCDESPDRAAPHGRWQITVRSDAPLAGLHAYVGRTEETLGAWRRGRQSYFSDPDADSEPGLVRADGTLNGHAFGQHTRVSAAYQWQGFPYRPMANQITEYSGVGPARRDGGAPVIHQAIAVEDGRFHLGMLSTGTRSGTLFRMQGTSLAAPLGVRRAAATQRKAIASASKAVAAQTMAAFATPRFIDPFDDPPAPAPAPAPKPAAGAPPSPKPRRGR